MNTQPRHPKCRALPVELHPDIHFSAMIPRRGVKIKIFLSVVIPVVKTAFVPFSATGEKPLLPVLQGFPGFCLNRSWIGSTHSQTRRDTNFAIPGYSLFCHDTTARGKNKVFSVCGHSCGQNRFCAAFSNRGKSRKRRRHKALRRFSLPCPGYRHGTPKAGALPTALHPVIYCRLERPPHSIPYSAPVFKSFLHRRPQKVVGLQYILDN